jgi:hypothetical protein
VPQAAAQASLTLERHPQQFLTLQFPQVTRAQQVQPEQLEPPVRLALMAQMVPTVPMAQRQQSQLAQ